MKSADLSIGNDRIVGTVSSMVVNNTGDLTKSPFYLMMLDSINTDTNNKQQIKYRVLRTTIADLFDEQKKPVFVEYRFERNLPVNGVCN